MPSPFESALDCGAQIVPFCVRYTDTHGHYTDVPAPEEGAFGPAEIEARLHAALQNGPCLCGDTYTAADLICASSYGFFPQLMPTDPLIKDWAARCLARPCLARAKAYDAALLAA